MQFHTKIRIAEDVKLTVIWIANRSQGWYERGASQKRTPLEPASRQA